MMNRNTYRWLPLLLALLLVVGASGAQAGPQDDRISLPNGFEIAFRGVDDNPDGTSTWHYYVDELPAAKDLSNWVLEVPRCFDILSATPRHWEAVYPDPAAAQRVDFLVLQHQMIFMPVFPG